MSTIHTRIGPRTARLMVWSFVGILFCLPLSQAVYEMARGRPPQVLDLFTQKPTRGNLKRFEDDVERSAVVRQGVQPHLQLALTQLGGFGNTKCTIGLDGWLFYQPGVNYLLGPGILDSNRLAQHRKDLLDSGETDPCSDPRPAIIAFSDACRAAGAHLIVVPIPDKSMLQPAQLTRRLAFDKPIAPPNNTDCSHIVADLRAAGVDVFDPTPPAIALGEIRFLRQDTHWTPQWMQSVARDLAIYAREKVPAIAASTREYTAIKEQVARVGDLVDMLNLPPGQTLYMPQSVTIERIAGWRPNPSADVVLLGDSFTNIYTAPEMGWGESAGFGPQLSRFLGRDLDVIARNGSGASATRGELAERPDPLGGKKLIIWEFAVRELTEENWRPIALTPRQPASDRATKPP